MSKITPIMKEREKKQNERITLIIGIIGYIYCVLAAMHTSALLRMYPRYTFSQALSEGLVNVFIKPLEIFPIDAGSTINILLVSFMIVMFILMSVATAKMKKHDNPDTVKGDAHFMTEQELADYDVRRADPVGKPGHDGAYNAILSQDIRLSMDGFASRRNINTLVIGGSGAGKSRFYVTPNLLQFNANYVFTDPSGELLDDNGKALEDAGYKVVVFNITDVYHGNRYNPFHYIHEEKDVFTLVNTLIANTTPPEKHAGDPFWENSEKLLLNALILYQWHVLPPEGQNFATTVKLINEASVDENDASAQSPLDILFEDLRKEDPENLAVQQYDTFKLGAGKTLKSILISVGVRLNPFKLSDMQYLTSEDEMDFEHFADQKTALFIIIPTADKTFNFIVSLLYSQLFMTLYNYVETRAKFGYGLYLNDNSAFKVFQAYEPEESKEAEKKANAYLARIRHGLTIRYNKKKKLYCLYTNKKELVAWRGDKKDAIALRRDLMTRAKVKQCPRKCPNDVRMMLDEFANIGQIPEFSEKLATIRKYRISCAIILQSKAQLKKMYKDDEGTIIGNCDSLLFLGTQDTDTLEWLSKLLGKKTTTVANMSWSSGHNGGGSQSFNKDSIDLMSIDQLAMMDDSNCIVRIRGERPYLGPKYELTKHPNYPKAHATSGQFYIPLSPGAANRRHGRLSERLAEKREAAANAKLPGEEEKEKAKKAQQPRKPVPESPKEREMRKAANRADKQKSMNAKKSLNDIRNRKADAARSEEEQASQTIAAFGFSTTNPSDEDIKETVGTVLNLNVFPNDTQFDYVATD